MTRRAGAADGHEDAEAFNDLPETHFSDEDYEAFVARELDAEGRPRGDPPVALVLGVVLAVVLGIMVLVFR